MNGSQHRRVVAFTATQIPGIDDRRYPPELAGPLYPEGIPIYPESELEHLVKDYHVDRCDLAYSDLSEHDVMEIMCRVLCAKADFETLCPQRTMLRSTKPVIAVTAVRTGSGKSQVSKYVIGVLKEHGLRTALVRHPMPYGDLAKQAVQRFSSYEDLDKQNVTIEEREEYEQHISGGTIVYAGVDYEAILRQAEKEADVIIWDGGNNDTPFYKPQPGLWICVADPHRAGQESTYYPGNVNFKCADVIIINKANTAPKEAVEKLKEAARARNPRAEVMVTDSVITVDNPKIIKGKRVVTVDDGPTITHGGMAYGAGKFAAEQHSAKIVDPKPYFVGSLKKLLQKYPHDFCTIPAIGYSPQQIKDLAETINKADADAVIIATPMDLNKLIRINKPTTKVKYEVSDEPEGPKLRDIINKFVKSVVKIP
ncbi:g6009 [Coccomyxa elongata]